MKRSDLLDSFVRHESEEWGLFQLHRQPLPKRLVKDRIACLVFKIRQNNRVLRREFWLAGEGKSIPLPRPAPESRRRRLACARASPE